VRPECPPFHWKAERFVSPLQIVLQQFQPRIWCDAHPYDAGLSKVWKCTGASNVERESPVRGGNLSNPRLHGCDTLSVYIT
jgi:hypothetical protein